MRPLLRGAQNGQPITRSSARFRFDGVSPDWPSRRPGGQQRFLNLAIETAVTLGLMFRLPLRQTEGFVWSIVTRRSRGGGRC